uniref:Uncharacterized protein n=1 Tax=Rhodopseudomonas palustris (strain BisA53) TaxID=316055 RepID=Q07V28_RHOP5
MSTVDSPPVSDDTANENGGKGSPPAEPIRAVDSPFFQVVLPMMAIIGFLVLTMLAIVWMNPSCTLNGYFAPIFALVFASAGVLVGGKIGVLLNIPMIKSLGVGINAVGGIAAAIAGWTIATYSLPRCDVWNSHISIGRIPISQPDRSINKPDFFVTVSVAPISASPSVLQKPLDVVVSNDSNNYGTLQFRLADTGNTVLFRLFRKEKLARIPDKADPSSTNSHEKAVYSYLGDCRFDIEPAKAYRPSPQNVIFVSQQSAQIGLKFRENYLQTYAEKSDLSETGSILNKCVEGYFTEANGSKPEQIFDEPLRFEFRRKALLGNQELVLSFTRQAAPNEDLQNPAALQNATLRSARDDTVNASSGSKEVVGAPGAHADSVVATASPAELPARATPEPDALLQEKASCIADEPRRGQMLAYLNGSDLDQEQRFELYRNWDQLSCLVLPVLENSAARFVSRNQGRSLRFLASTIINKSNEANATYWQSNNLKRDFNKSLPSYVDGKYIELIINLVASEDDYVRAEAIRFVKLLPNHQVENQFQRKFDNLADLKSSPKREYFAIGASALYYNRIVEWLNLPDSAKADQRTAATGDISKDFAKAQSWMRDDLFVDKSPKPFSAMLYYARAIVEREGALTPDIGKGSFGQMLALLRSTNEPYPSRAKHIGQALVYSGSFAEKSPDQRSGLRAVQGATEYDLVRVMDGKDPFANKKYPLFFVPDARAPALGAQVSADDSARLLLQSGDWHLVSAVGKIGWIYTPKS